MDTEVLVEGCPVCAGATTEWRVKKTPDGPFVIERCDGCGYAFVNPRPTRAALIEFYATHGHAPDEPSSRARPMSADDVLQQEARYPNSGVDAARLTSQALEVLQSALPAQSSPRLLDVGCGYGFVSRAARRLGFEVVALELAASERAIATELAAVTPLEQAFEEFAAPPGSFDVVVLSQVLEHVFDVNQWVGKAAELLRPGGVLVVALPNFASVFRLLLNEREPYICPPQHLNFFSPDNLSQLVSRHQFQVARLGTLSRLPRTTFEKRLPRLGPRLIDTLEGSAAFALRRCDAINRGMMINLYARRA